MTRPRNPLLIQPRRAPSGAAPAGAAPGGTLTPEQYRQLARLILPLIEQRLKREREVRI